MRYSLSTAAMLFFCGLASAQTFTDCDPTKKTCPSNPGLGGSSTTDFTKGASKDWTLADGTTMSYDPANGAVFEIKTKTNAPTVAFSKYIMFGKVSVTMQAAPGAGIVSSFILESADLDEIDWEWIGSVDTEAQSNFFGKGDTTTYDRGKVHAMSGAVSGFHTYEIDWNKDTTTWSIDGKVVRTLAFTDPVAHAGANYPQTPMKVKMGSWVGCADSAAAADPKTKGTCEWAKGPADFSKAPLNMYVKSVTIQDYGCGGDYTYSDTTGSYQSIKSSGKCDGKANTDAPSSSAKIPQITAGDQVSSGSVKATDSASATASASASGSSSVSAPASSTATGAVFATASTSNGSAPAATGGASSNGSNGSNQTTLATTSAKPTATGSGAAASNTSSAGNAVKPSKYGAIDVAVMALGLGLGYLVM